jgi:DNA-binding GntR family transcriptional regulator
MENRTDSLRDALEDQILTGVLRPGDRLDEVSLAERFGVSRTPIREALFQLAATGLVEHRPRRGAFVANVGPRRLSEMFEVMAELESLCARLAARRATAQDIAAITAAHTACEAAAASGNSDAYYYANEEFHQRIRLIGGNEFLLDQVDALQKRLKAYRRIQLRARDRIRSSFDEHARIVTAIEAGDAEAAGDAMRCHVAVQGDRFADLLSTLSRELPQNTQAAE